MSGLVSSYRDFAQKVLSAADIVEVVGSYVELKRAGANYKALCPFHQEKTPSFNVHPARQIYKCFGCGKGGDVIHFVREIERADFREALEILARRYGLEVPQFQARGADEEHLRRRQNLCQVLEAAALWYQERLRHPRHGERARRYLAERGLGEAVIALFRLGVAPSEEWDGLTRHLTDKGFTPRALIEAGVAREQKQGGGVYDYLRDRLIFPILNSRGEVIAFGGRAFGEEMPKYLNTAETELFSKGRELYGLSQARDALTRRQQPAVLVEGYMDVIASHQAGLAGAVASMGTALTPDQARLIGRYSRNVALLYDSDEAGLKATLRGIEVLVAGGLDVRVARVPVGEDPDSYARKKGPEALQQVVREARPYFDFLLSHARQGRDLASPEGRLRALEVFEPVLGCIGEELVYDDYVRRLAAEMDHKEDALRRYLKGRVRPAARRETPHALVPEGGADRPARQEELDLVGAGPPPRTEMALLHILLEHGDARLVVRERLNAECIAHPRVRYWVDMILRLDDTVSDVWKEAQARCQSPEDEAFLHSVAFGPQEPLEGDYVTVAEHLADRILSQHRHLQNRRLNQQIAEMDEAARRAEMTRVVEAQMRNLKERVEARTRARENPCVEVKHP